MYLLLFLFICAHYLPTDIFITSYQRILEHFDVMWCVILSQSVSIIRLWLFCLSVIYNAHCVSNLFFRIAGRFSVYILV